MDEKGNDHYTNQYNAQGKFRRLILRRKQVKYLHNARFRLTQIELELMEDKPDWAYIANMKLELLKQLETVTDNETSSANQPVIDPSRDFALQD